MLRIHQFEQRLASPLKLQGRQLVFRQETEPAMEVVQGESCRGQLAGPAPESRQILSASRPDPILSDNSPANPCRGRSPMGARPSGQAVQAAAVCIELPGLFRQLVRQVCRRTIQHDFVFQVDLQAALVPSEILCCRFETGACQDNRASPASFRGRRPGRPLVLRYGFVNVTGADYGDATGSPRIAAA